MTESSEVEPVRYPSSAAPSWETELGEPDLDRRLLGNLRRCAEVVGRSFAEVIEAFLAGANSPETLKELRRLPAGSGAWSELAKFDYRRDRRFASGWISVRDANLEAWPNWLAERLLWDRIEADAHRIEAETARRGAAMRSLDAAVTMVSSVVKPNNSNHIFAILIWAAHTHIIPLFTSTFYLCFSGKTGAGKGTSVEACILLTPNGVVLGNCTEAYLAAILDEGKAVGIEEWDKLSEKNPFIESLVRNGYRRGAHTGLMVPSDREGGWQPGEKSLFGPRVYDSHKGPSGHLLGRTVLIEMDPDDSIDRALDAEDKDETLAPVRAELASMAAESLASWSAARVKSHWKSAPFRERVASLFGRTGRDHVIGAIMLLTCDIMGWDLDETVREILKGRPVLEEYGLEAEVLETLRTLVPSPATDTELSVQTLLQEINASRKRVELTARVNPKALAAALKEVGFRKGGDGSDPLDEWYKARSGPNRDRVVLRPARLLSRFGSTPGDASQASHPSQLPLDEDGTGGTYGTFPAVRGDGAPTTASDARAGARNGFDQGSREEGV